MKIYYWQLVFVLKFEEEKDGYSQKQKMVATKYALQISKTHLPAGKLKKKKIMLLSQKNHTQRNYDISSECLCFWPYPWKSWPQTRPQVFQIIHKVKKNWKNKLTESTKKSYFLKKVGKLKQTTLLTTANNCHTPQNKEKKRREMFVDYKDKILKRISSVKHPISSLI